MVSRKTAFAARMSFVYHLEKASIQLPCGTVILPAVKSIKQEVQESPIHINNELHIKEEVLSDSELNLNFGVLQPSEKLYECKFCDYKTYTESLIVSHSRKHTAPFDDDKTLSCETCSYKTKRRSHFNDHIRSHTGDKPYECNYCEYKSGLKGNLKRHVSRIHSTTPQLTNSKTLHCAHCSYTCPNKGLLIRHVKMHTLAQTYDLRSGIPPKPYEKPEFIDIHSLNVDQQGNLLLDPVKLEPEQPKNLKCPECMYTCVRRTHLNDHLKTHSGEKPFVCIMCNYRTGHKSHLTRHMKVHVKREGHVILKIPPPPLPVPATKQVLRCLLCGYKTQIKHCFAKHMRLHLGVALFTCNICDFSAKCSADIKQHIKIHDGVNEFRCNRCAYKAKSKGRLRRHLAIHRSR